MQWRAPFQDYFELILMARAVSSYPARVASGKHFQPDASWTAGAFWGAESTGPAVLVPDLQG